MVLGLAEPLAGKQPFVARLAERYQLYYAFSACETLILLCVPTCGSKHLIVSTLSPLDVSYLAAEMLLSILEGPKSLEPCTGNNRQQSTYQCL